MIACVHMSNFLSLGVRDTKHPPSLRPHPHPPVGSRVLDAGLTPESAILGPKGPLENCTLLANAQSTHEHNKATAGKSKGKQKAGITPAGKAKFRRMLKSCHWQRCALAAVEHSSFCKIYSQT